jgi:hypothetical protein
MAETTKYQGSCHCGNVRFEVKTDLANVISCNCSIFVPAADFELIAGDGAQSDYQFNRKNIHHLFCKTCGVRSFGHGKGPDGSAMYAVNVRTLDGVDLDALKVKQIDGKKF